MKYTSQHFREVYPAWAWKKCSFVVRHLYRPLSFHCAAWAANCGINANQVSYASCLVSVMACALFFVNNYAVNIIGAVLFNVWLLMDCIDGNLARGVKKLPFGVFADAMGSYLLVGLMGVAIGFAVYRDGGILFHSGNPFMIVMAALASNGDSLMRLIYQKYKNVEREMADEGICQLENDVFKNPDDAKNILVRIEFEFGAGGILPLGVLIATIFHALDLVVLYIFLYYFGASVLSILMYARRAIKRERQITKQ